MFCLLECGVADRMRERIVGWVVLHGLTVVFSIPATPLQTEYFRRDYGGSHRGQVE